MYFYIIVLSALTDILQLKNRSIHKCYNFITFSLQMCAVVLLLNCLILIHFYITEAVCSERLIIFVLYSSARSHITMAKVIFQGSRIQAFLDAILNAIFIALIHLT